MVDHIGFDVKDQAAFVSDPGSKQDHLTDPLGHPYRDHRASTAGRARELRPDPAHLVAGLVPTTSFIAGEGVPMFFAAR
jgi:hypothetical protein